MGKEGWGSSTGQGRLNLIKCRNVVSILEMKDAMRDGLFMDETITWKDAVRTQMQTNQP